MLDGAGQTVNTNAYSPLSFRSEAPINTFQEVKVDGETVDDSNYTVTEGSTIVTFNADYSRALSSGDHTVEIISDNGSATASFDVTDDKTIPEDGIYYTGAELCFDCLCGYGFKGHACSYCGYDGFTNEPTILTEFPDTPLNSDIYEFGDYQYTYVQSVDGYDWEVSVKDKTKTEYEQFLEFLIDKPIISLSRTFMNCSNLKNIDNIVIPNGIKYMEATFYNCQSFTNEGVTNLKLPDGVTHIPSLFADCKSITDASSFKIPNTVTSIGTIFHNCSELKLTPQLPNSITEMRSAFENCTSLEIAPKIPSNVTIFDSAFKGCTSLKDISNVVIPSGVDDIGCLFERCVSLTDASNLIIHENIKDINWMFEDCTSLSGSITINSTPRNYKNALKNTQITEILGNCKNKADILATK